jgi:hypothetical protein
VDQAGWSRSHRVSSEKGRKGESQDVPIRLFPAPAMKRVRLKRKRKTKLLQPRLQLKLVGSFLGLCALALLLQFLVFGMRLSELASIMPDGSYLTAYKSELMVETLLFSFGLLLPTCFAVGILITHRIAGPVHRLEDHLKRIARGEEVGRCRLRKGDNLQDLCERVNDAVEYLRSERSQAAEVVEQRSRRVRAAG